MQEEVENRTLTLGINTTKFTGRVLKAALSKYLAHRKEKKLQASRDSPGVKPFGKISILWVYDLSAAQVAFPVPVKRLERVRDSCLGEQGVQLADFLVVRVYLSNPVVFQLRSWSTRKTKSLSGCRTSWNVR